MSMLATSGSAFRCAELETELPLSEGTVYRTRHTQQRQKQVIYLLLFSMNCWHLTNRHKKNKNLFFHSESNLFSGKLHLAKITYLSDYTYSSDPESPPSLRDSLLEVAISHNQNPNSTQIRTEADSAPTHIATTGKNNVCSWCYRTPLWHRFTYFTPRDRSRSLKNRGQKRIAP